MVEYLSFEVCQSNDDSRYIKLFLESECYYLEIVTGHRGIYLTSHIKTYCCDCESLNPMLKDIESLDLYRWPKTIPSDYIPENHIMGCDSESWSIQYQEIGKKRSHHIHGKGLFPKKSPYIDFLKYIDTILPEKGFMEWVFNENRIDIPF